MLISERGRKQMQIFPFFFLWKRKSHRSIMKNKTKHFTNMWNCVQRNYGTEEWRDNVTWNKIVFLSSGGNDLPPQTVAGACLAKPKLDGNSSLSLTLNQAWTETLPSGVTGAFWLQTWLWRNSAWWICINQSASDSIRRAAPHTTTLPSLELWGGADEESLYAKLGLLCQWPSYICLFHVFCSILGLITNRTLGV